MNEMNKEDFLSALELLIKQAPKALADVATFALTAEAQLTRLHSQLQFLVGGSDRVTVVPSASTKLEPITEFMGVPINRAKPVTQSQLTPKEQEKALLQEKADRLEESIHTLENENILDSYKNDVLPIRLVAKRAGLEDFKTAEINGTYLDEIRSAMKSQAEYEAKQREEQAKIDEAANKQ